MESVDRGKAVNAGVNGVNGDDSRVESQYSRLRKVFLEHPNLTPKQACAYLSLNYRVYGHTARSIKHQVRYNRRFGLSTREGGRLVSLDGFVGHRRVEVVPGVLEVHGLSYDCLVGPVWYGKIAGRCVESRNRNGQRRFEGGLFSFVLHKPNPSNFGYAKLVLGVKTKKAEYGLLSFKKFLIETLGLENAEMLYRQVAPSAPDPHVAIHAPNVTPKVRIRIPGVGSLRTDKTPWADGTVELELDRSEQIDFFKSLQADLMSKLTESFSSTMEKFAKSFRDELDLIRKSLTHTEEEPPFAALDERRYT